MSNQNQHHPDDPVHIAACPDCQARAGLESLDLDLDRVWRGVAAEVWPEPTGHLERRAIALLRSPGLARALVTTPSLVLSWLIATAVVLVLGVVATRAGETPWVALLAPALAGAGIAYAYGSGVDPAFELSRTMPIGQRMILLVRVLAVFGVNAILGLAASLFVPGAGSVTWGWLVPMAMISALALAAATLSQSANTGVLAALAGWTIVVLASKAESGDAATAVGTALMPAYALATVLFIGLAAYGTGWRRRELSAWR